MQKKVIFLLLLCFTLSSCTSFSEKANQIIDDELANNARENNIEIENNSEIDNTTELGNNTELNLFISGIQLRIKKKLEISNQITDYLGTANEGIEENNTEKTEEGIQALAETASYSPSGVSDYTLMTDIIYTTESTMDYSNIQDTAVTKIKEILNNPDSSIGELLNAAEISQQLGIQETEVYELAMIKIKLKLESILNEEGLSQFELLQIATICQSLGFEDLGNLAIEKATSAPTYGSTIESITEYKSEKQEKKITITATGDLKQNSILGYSGEDSKNYFFNYGSVKYSYYDKWENECAITAVMGAGTLPLRTALDGQFDIYGDNYEGYIVSKSISVAVEISPKIPFSEGCEDSIAEIETRTQQEMIQIFIKGTTQEGSNRISDSSTEVFTEYENTEDEKEVGTTKNTWNIRIPSI